MKKKKTFLEMEKKKKNQINKKKRIKGEIAKNATEIQKKQPSRIYQHFVLVLAYIRVAHIIKNVQSYISWDSWRSVGISEWYEIEYINECCNGTVLKPHYTKEIS